MAATWTRRLALPAAAALIVSVAPSAPGQDLGPPQTSGSVAAAQLSGTPLSGTQELYGHTLTWSLSGASAPSAELADSYDGVVSAGATVTFSGSATYSIGKAATNLSQRANLSGTDGVSFSERVGEGTYTLPYSLSTTAPKAPEEANAGDVVSALSASVSSRNCNDSGVCGGPSIDLSLAVVKTSGDTVKPMISLKKRPKIYADVGKKRAKRHANVARFPLKLTFRMSDNSGKAKGTVRVYSGGTVISGASTKKFVKNGRYSLKLKKTPPGSGPFYWCAQANDRAGNYSPIKCKWLSIAVPISRGNVNGCGTAGYGPTAEWLQNYFGDVREYGYGLDRTKVAIRNACNIHDAAYIGMTIFHAIDKEYVDFRQWTRLQIDKRFRADIRTLCKRDLSAKRMRPHLRTCMNGVGLATLVTLIPTSGLSALEDAGADTYFDLVREYGAVGFDADSTTPGTQEQMPNRTFPPGGARDNT